MTASQQSAPTVIGPDGLESYDFGGFGVVWKIDGEASEGRFSIVDHPLAPRELAAPLHRHNREDEYSFVLEGTLGALLDDEVVTAGPGSWVFKPRGQWHTFWNAGDEPCRIIEVISPAGFEDFFREARAAFPPGQEPDVQLLTEISARYELEMDVASVPELCERFGLRFRQP